MKEEETTLPRPEGISTYIYNMQSWKVHEENCTWFYHHNECIETAVCSFPGRKILALQRVLQGKNPGTYWVGDWVCPRSKRLGEEKSLAPTGIRTPDYRARSLVAIPTTLLRHVMESAEKCFTRVGCTRRHPFPWDTEMDKMQPRVLTKIRVLLGVSEVRPECVSTDHCDHGGFLCSWAGNVDVCVSNMFIGVAVMSIRSNRGRERTCWLPLFVIYFGRTASHSVSVRQVGIWTAATPTSDLHMSFNVQEKGFKRVLYFAVLRN